jgi:phytoene dehydrogenase-like protein
MKMSNGRIWDVVVVGAGAAGLTASIYMARAGLQVLVLEKGSEPGGRAVSTMFGGARVNLGAHALYAEAAAILGEVGVTAEGGTPKLSGSFVFGHEAGGLKAADLAHLLLGGTLYFGEKMELLRFFSSLWRLRTEPLRNVSVQNYLETYVRHPRVRRMIEAFIRVSTYCNAPELLSAGDAFRQLQHAKVVYPHGGWQSIADALRAQAERAGAVIRTGAPAVRIAGAEPAMTVELKDGERIQSRKVLSTAAPGQLLAMLDSPPAPEYAARMTRLTPIYAACLDIVLDGLPDPKTNFALGVDRPWYFSNHSTVAKLSEHEGLKVVHVMTYLPAGDQPASGTSAQGEAELERLMDLLQPGWQRHVAAQRFLPRMLVASGIPAAAEGGLAGRPGAAVAGKPGLYAAGDWVGAEGMLLHASLASAKTAARCIIGENESQRTGTYG